MTENKEKAANKRPVLPPLPDTPVKLTTEEDFNKLLQIFDHLHDAAAHGLLATVTQLDARDTIGVLDDVIFTAEEIIRELQAHIEAESIDLNESDHTSD